MVNKARFCFLSLFDAFFLNYLIFRRMAISKKYFFKKVIRLFAPYRGNLYLCIAFENKGTSHFGRLAQLV